MGLNAENIIFVKSFEGRTGCSFTAVNIAYGLVLEGKRVLIADCGTVKNKPGVPKMQDLAANESKAVYKIQSNLGYLFLRNFENKSEIETAADKYSYNNIDYIIVDIGNAEMPELLDAKNRYGIVVVKEGGASLENCREYFDKAEVEFLGKVENMVNSKNYYEKFSETAKGIGSNIFESKECIAVIPFEESVAFEEKMWIPYIYKNYGNDVIEALRDLIDIILDLDEEEGNEFLKEEKFILPLNSAGELAECREETEYY